MRKNIFVKYLLTFIIIIVVSFSVLLGILTAMIRAYSSEDKDDVLIKSTEVIAQQIEKENVSNLASYVYSLLPNRIISPIVSLNPDLNIFLCDTTGKLLLTTVDAAKDGLSARYRELGTLDLSAFTETNKNGKNILQYDGWPDGIVKEKSRFFACKIRYDDGVIGYVVSARSTHSEDSFVNVVRSAIFTSSIWVTLAALIAVYFITERMMRPLREITKTTKSYAKGDFSTRVQIYGEDEIAELGRSFNQMADSLEKTEIMRNSFMANVSHDLRTPMTTIAGFIDGINSGAIPPEKQGYYLNVISAEVHRLSRLVSEILDVSRLESGDRKFVYTDFDIAEMARLILISFEQKIDEKKLNVDFESDDSVFVNADKDAMYQVLYNLCHNAIKFAKEGGDFRIVIEPVPEGKKIRVRVYDEGQTIPQEDVPFVFDRFYKTDKSRGLDKNGVGLGLYISQTIVHSHDETIGVLPSDEGCEFFFTLKQGHSVPRKNTAELE